MRILARRAPILVVLAGLLWTSPAVATYTITGAHGATKQVGGAGVSCPTGGQGSVSLYELVHEAVPGVAVGHSLGAPNEAARDQALVMIEMGSTPQQALDTIVMGDAQVALRIYGFSDVLGQSAGYFGGSPTISPGGDLQNTVGDYTYSVQGGILTPNVLTNAAMAFETEGCDLAEKLMLAIEAGAAGNGGDSRCTGPFMTPGETAFLQVDDPSYPEGQYLKIVVPGLTQPDDPIAHIRAAYDEWRQMHPCPGIGGTESGESGDDSSGDPSTSGTSTGGEGTSDTSSSATSAAATTHGPDSTEGDGGSAATTTAGTGDGDGDGETGGCSCSHAGPRDSFSLIVLLGLRRRRSWWLRSTS